MINRATNDEPDSTGLTGLVRLRPINNCISGTRLSMKILPMTSGLLLLALACWSGPVQAGVNARLLRQPDVSRTQITFVYAGDIWVVPKEGGTAHRLSSPPGEESYPRFSPDGAKIAFTANYDGNPDIYVIDASGGLVTRVTHHPGSERMLDWYADGKTLLLASGMQSGSYRFMQLYKVSARGGLPEKLPIPYAEMASISRDGQWVAYTPT
jgi:tricorn protease